MKCNICDQELGEDIWHNDRSLGPIHTMPIDCFYALRRRVAELECRPTDDDLNESYAQGLKDAYTDNDPLGRTFPHYSKMEYLIERCRVLDAVAESIDWSDKSDLLAYLAPAVTDMQKALMDLPPDPSKTPCTAPESTETGRVRGGVGSENNEA